MLVAHTLSSKNILLIIGGSIAAYKALDLIRRLRERGARVRVILTKAAQAFVTPLAISVLTGEHVFTNLFSCSDAQDINHIRLAREVDMIVIAPCSSTRLAKMACGFGTDFAGTVLLATRAPVLAAPAMNPAMWNHPATQRNIAQLTKDGIFFTGPENGEMAECGEAGEGRMSEPLSIVAAVESLFVQLKGFLADKHILVTSGPTHEPLDPVRYFANRSSGKQGHAIATVLARSGAHVTLVSGPVALADPTGVNTIHVETAQQMRAAVLAALPADAAIFVAAVADWRPVAIASKKIKKQPNFGQISLNMIANPDILSEIAHSKRRPQLVIGFAAETFDVLEHAKAKLFRKGADWIIVNDVSRRPDGSGIMGGDQNKVTVMSCDNNVESWPQMDKTTIAEKLVQRITDFFKDKSGEQM
ncbi:MAG: phosphopantothenoylcysteine decarboxylase / phosphopantothenate--cysteine ligase [Candidatus Tokpelaia sp. JSC085]|nr:MAG: phosphopantothenoylcysteine decarboxylase / phosphopantothenate--cysteine ligase [Candidatus Tokpelaia sp. JSC085]